MRKIAPALAEVMAVYETGKPWIVSIDILKEFRGENNLHGFPSNPPQPSNQREEKLVEIPNISNKPQLSEHVTPL